MIKYNFDRIFKARGIDRPFTYLVKSGFSDNFATKVKNNKVRRLGLKEMEKLCLLLHCTPNEFLEWEPDANNQISQDHPLYKIRKTDKVFDLTKMLNSIPPGNLDKIEEILSNAIKG